MRYIILITLLFSFPLYATENNSVPLGAINENITQENIHSTICVPNFTDTIRPDTQYTNKLKFLQIEQRKYSDNNMRSYEEDHYIPLGIGGHPRDKNNLWPQPYSGKCGAKIKDILESKLHNMICSGKILLKDAQKEISTDWVASYNRHIRPLKCN